MIKHPGRVEFGETVESVCRFWGGYSDERSAATFRAEVAV